MAECVGVGWLQNFCFRNFAKFLISCFAKFSSNSRNSKLFCQNFAKHLLTQIVHYTSSYYTVFHYVIYNSVGYRFEETRKEVKV